MRLSAFQHHLEHLLSPYELREGGREQKTFLFIGYFISHDQNDFKSNSRKEQFIWARGFKEFRLLGKEIARIIMADMEQKTRHEGARSRELTRTHPEWPASSSWVPSVSQISPNSAQKPIEDKAQPSSSKDPVDKVSREHTSKTCGFTKR